MAEQIRALHESELLGNLDVLQCGLGGTAWDAREVRVRRTHLPLTEVLEQTSLC